MKNVSAFDIIGPIMIGPSSSHTAGALRIALIAYKIFNGTIEEVDFTLYGSFEKTYKGHGTDRALLGGILGFDTDNVKIRDSYAIADSKNIKYRFIPGKIELGMHPNTVQIDIKGEGKSLSILGESVGGGSVLIKKINGIEVKFTGEYTSIIIQQFDRPGVVAKITKILSDNNINIAFMSLYRESYGEKAFTILELDQSVSKEILDEIKSSPNIMEAFQVEF